MNNNIEADNKILPPDNKVVATAKKVRNDFQEFAFTNKFIAGCIGVSIGLGTKDYIQNVLNKVILPLLYKIGQLLFNRRLYQIFEPYHTIINFIGELLWDTASWIILILLTFVILEYVLNRKILGLKNVLPPEEEVKFLKAKKEAQKKSIIIPNDDEIVELKQKEEAEKEEKDSLYSTSSLLKVNSNIFKIPHYNKEVVKTNIESFPTGLYK